MAIAKVYTFYKGNDQNIELTGLADGDTGVTIAAATITFNLYDPNSLLVPNAGPITLIPTGTSGNYIGLLTNAFDPPVAGGYTIKLDTVLSGIKAHFEIPAEVRVRAA